MKKLFFCCLVFLLTGCLGEAGHGYITKECVKENFVNGQGVLTSVLVKSKDGNLVSIVINEAYDFDDMTSIINSKKSEQNLYSQLSGITLDMDDNTFTYNIDVENADELVKTRFSIKSEQHKMIKYYEENGYTCN